MTADLVAFLRARLDENKQTARAATPGPWVDRGGYVTDMGPDGVPQVQVTDYGTQDGEPEEDNPQGRADSAHIVRHDPARVLADVDAKRQAVAKCAEWLSYGPVGDTEVDRAGDGAYVDAAETMLRLLALPYADHPDYREEWRP